MTSINDEIMEIWKRAKPENKNGLMPLFYPDFRELRKGSILFIGINPSFSERGFKSFLSDSKYGLLDFKTFYAYPNSGVFDVNKSVAIDKLAVEKHPYFRKFHEISEKIGLEWEHVDLFFIRETNQKKLKKYIFEKGEKLNSFGLDQLAVAKKIIEKIEPRIIVVANALASRLFKVYFDAHFSVVHGCHFAKILGKEVPVFLTSMLTGQRALDNFTFYRLRWHIAKVVSVKL